MFQSSFELTGYITQNKRRNKDEYKTFQSSFELTGYITVSRLLRHSQSLQFQSSFELTGYITRKVRGRLKFEN